MKVILSLFFWTTGLLFFMIIFPIIAISVLTAGPERSYLLIRILFRIQLLLVGTRLTVSGYENFDKNGTYLLMGNHESLFDIFAVPIAIPMRIIGVEAAGHFKVPFWGYLIKIWGNIPIQRKNLPEAKKSIEQARQMMEKGQSLLIMPEGGRTVTGEIKEFKKGPFHLALASKTDILPFAMKGLYRAKNKNSWMITPTRASIHIGKPIPYESYRNMSVEQLREQMRGIISGIKDNLKT